MTTLFDSVLKEVLASLLAPDLRRRVLETATAGVELRLEDAQGALRFVDGPLRDALTDEVGQVNASDLVADMRDILEPLDAAPGDADEPKRQPESGRRRRESCPSAAESLRISRERPTPALGIRRDAIGVPQRPREFDEVPTADLPSETLEALRGRDTLGPPSHASSPCILLSADPSRRDALARGLGEHTTIIQAAGERALLALLEDPLPAGTIFIVDAEAQVSARAFAQHLSRLPRASTVIIWGSEHADLTRPEMAALGFVPSSGEASPRELAELLLGLRAA
ncbi:MAG: hypothetical protein GXP55_12385 [Deltaproteobacteria bacterium]|nr:hypothetical protein [Deltaproteobacteria bacterium]